MPRSGLPVFDAEFGINDARGANVAPRPAGGSMRGQHPARRLGLLLALADGRVKRDASTTSRSTAGCCRCSTSTETGRAADAVLDPIPG